MMQVRKYSLYQAQMCKLCGAGQMVQAVGSRPRANHHSIKATNFYLILFLNYLFIFIFYLIRIEALNQVSHWVCQDEHKIIVTKKKEISYKLIFYILAFLCEGICTKWVPYVHKIPLVNTLWYYLKFHFSKNLTDTSLMRSW